ncbi:chymotrypsin BII-like isoform X1 [Tribolium madens]|uniref:chymotrypsin BII-like isoform X1 n=1 Tax=Tribolium madens TaxID=41895 RepID=UPI001CF749A7|nr:chymotrypsin BII-like isoform X1 [Tribolium madens]
MFSFYILVFVLISPSLQEAVVNRNNQNTRIIGGHTAHISQVPFVAAINVEGSGYNWFCGGALYGNQWIITAGQCVNGATLFTIRLGAISLTEPDENRVTFSTSTFFLHPEFNTETLENDIGLIKLRMPVTHTSYIKSVNYLALSKLWDNTHVYVMGWGQTSDDNGTLSDDLKMALVTTLPNEECKVIFGNQIKESMVCVDGQYNEGACHGDTGSPLILLHPRGVTEHVGISSFVSFNGCETPEPSGYTRTYLYNDWINNTTKNN